MSPPTPPAPPRRTSTQAPSDIAADSVERIKQLRTQIDLLDANIVRLVTQRCELSQEVQAARVAAGGDRVELDREREISQTYRTALGESGQLVAEAVLQACRGAR